ncbi:MAG TPA: 3'-5' exonuclease, partial [Candidatus Sulfotelmatobacter sp.]|nr:3'-5' exonuclease [Candidatus Sulfotelmatobacter sp.]
WLKPLGTFLDEAYFLASLTCTMGKADPLVEDWTWVRPQMTTLLHLTQEFTQAFTQAKRELGMVDFHDLEQHALRLLWDPKANQPTRTAGEWRKKLRFVFVDEYQDINAAQDKIIEALSRQGKQANRFLVGDVKQSIYRFRLANPHIFQSYVDTWSGGQGKVIPLVENFRSRERVLEFINSLFEAVMRREVGGVPYDDQARLRFGALEQRQPLSRAANATACAELLLRLKSHSETSEAEEEHDSALAEVRDLEEVDKEARMVALRLRELKTQQHPVWDEQLQQFRPVEWRDMAILLRSPSRKTESYAKEFSRLNVPLQVARGGFYQSLEVSDLLSLLQLLDNPLQDLPVLAVLHSPLVGLTLNELATIRLTLSHIHFWTALVRWEEARKAEYGVGSAEGGMQQGERRREHGEGSETNGKGEGETYRKASLFLERFGRWRRLARQVSLTRCLEAVLSETHYAEWLLTQARGEQRHANVQRLIGLAQQFDQFQRQGLFRFLRFIEAQQMADTEPNVAPVSEDNAVRLLSIHQSKGLEFPVVVVADLGKPFNASDLRSDIILDEVYGLCPQIKPPHTGKRYPSLPYWLARQRQMRELLGEELRLLYVAMTRARDTLILSGAVSAARFNTFWKHQAKSDLTAVLAARSYADWLGLWFGQSTAIGQDGAARGENHCLRWVIQDDTQLIIKPGDTTGTADSSNESILDGDPEWWRTLQQRLAWAYAFTAAARQPAKTSVTVLRRRAAAVADDATSHLLGAESPRLAAADTRTKPETQGHSRGAGKISGADIGNAHHTFLQHVALDHTNSIEALKQEAQRLQREGALSAEEIGLLNFKGLAAFWKSALGRKVRSNAQFVRRELVFTSRFSPKDLVPFTGEPVDAYLEDEFIIVQGVADLAVVLPQEIWVIDFKTDGVTPSALADKAKAYAPQLKLYAQALAQIYRRPVTECWLYFLARQAAVPVR